MDPRIGMLLLKEVNYSADLKCVFSRSRSVLRKRIGIINRIIDKEEVRKVGGDGVSDFLVGAKVVNHFLR